MTDMISLSVDYAANAVLRPLRPSFLCLWCDRKDRMSALLWWD